VWLEARRTGTAWRTGPDLDLQQAGSSSRGLRKTEARPKGTRKYELPIPAVCRLAPPAHRSYPGAACARKEIPAVTITVPTTSCP